MFYEGHFILCYKEKLEPVERAMANLIEVTGLHDFRCYLCVASLSLTPLYNLPCASPLFWLISIARYVFKSPSICF